MDVKRVNTKVFVLMGVDSPLQNIVVGAVLVLAVWLDGVYKRRVG